jgi:hypothetical protein
MMKEDTNMNWKTRLWLGGLCAVLFASCPNEAGDTSGRENEVIASETPAPGEITAFSIEVDGAVYEGIIDRNEEITAEDEDEEDATEDEAVTAGFVISVVVPQDADLSALAPEIAVTKDALVSPASGVARDFSGSEEKPLVYTVSGGKTYAVTVVNAGTGSDARAITAFDITIEVEDDEGETEERTFNGTINEKNKTITLVLPYQTPLASLAPTITLSEGASVDPASGAARNFTASSVAPVAYTVRAENGMRTRYKAAILTEGKGGAANPLGMTLALLPAAVSLPPSTLNATVSATAGFDSYTWRVNGAEVPEEHGRNITITRADYIIGPHNLSVIAWKDNVPFHADMIFTIEP